MGDQLAMFILFVVMVIIIVYRFTSTGNYADEIPLKTGTYRIGEDIPPGKGDLVAVSGGGDFCIKERGNTEWNHFNKLGVTSPVQPSRYRNLGLSKGDILEINGNVTMLIIPPTAIRDPLLEDLCIGVYRFGQDVPPGKYDLEVVSGDGQIYFFDPGQKEYSICQDMSIDGGIKATSYANIPCVKGAELWVEGSLTVKLTYSKKQPIWL